MLRSDNGLVFSSKHYTNTLTNYGLTQAFITPYTPEQNRLMERFFRSLKEECFWQHRFESLAHARHGVGQWIRFYNNERPHQSLGYAGPSARPALAPLRCAETRGSLQQYCPHSVTRGRNRLEEAGAYGLELASAAA